MTLPHRPVLGLTVTQQSRSTTLLVTDFGLKVRFNGVAALVVKLPESFAGTSRARARSSAAVTASVASVAAKYISC